MFTPIPDNDKRLTKGSILLPTSNPVAEGGEAGKEFIKALGGSDDTFVALLGMQGSALYGMPLGKEPFRPRFTPSWGLAQLCAEIDAGVWKVVQTSEDPAYHREMMRRLKALQDAR